MIDNLLDLYEISECILKSREYASYLYENKLINQEIKENIERKCDELQKVNECFITKPFRASDSNSKSLYHMMKSISRNVPNLENIEKSKS